MLCTYSPQPQRPTDLAGPCAHPWSGPSLITMALLLMLLVSNPGLWQQCSHQTLFLQGRAVLKLSDLWVAAGNRLACSGTPRFG